LTAIDSDELLRDLCSFTDTLLGTLGRTVEVLYNKTADDDLARAAKAWAIFSNVVMLDFADAALLLVRSGKLRAVMPIARSLYEFYVTLVYFERHREFPLKQLQTVAGRRLLRATQGPYLSDDDRNNVVKRLEEWKRLVGERQLDAYSGNRNFRDMAFEVENESEDYHPTYAARYGIPSMFAHPDGGAVPDVLVLNDDAASITVAWRTHTIDARLAIASINDTLVHTVLFMNSKFDCALENYDRVLETSSALARRLLVAKGFDAGLLDGGSLGKE
jgi:hypothetical protein